MWEQEIGLLLPGAPPLEGSKSYYGLVVYAYGLGLDQPLSVARFGYADFPDGGSHTPWPAHALLPLWDPHGRPVTGTYGNGDAVKKLQSGPTQSCVTNPATSLERCVWLFWSFSWSAYDQKTEIRPMSWHGTLLENKRDYAGTYYRRNRAYDPATGPFTQEDPSASRGDSISMGLPTAIP